MAKKTTAKKAPAACAKKPVKKTPMEPMKGCEKCKTTKKK